MIDRCTHALQPRRRGAALCCDRERHFKHHGVGIVAGCGSVDGQLTGVDPPGAAVGDSLHNVEYGHGSAGHCGSVADASVHGRK